MIEIKRRFSGAVLYSGEHETIRDALSAAAKAGIDLARADLAGADLADADLAGAYLAGANLARADLAGANLAGADLAGAYLARANLAGAYLAGADLARADLAGADLAGAYLAGADLAGAYLARADLADAYLAGAYLAGAYLAGANVRTDPATQAEREPETREQWLARRSEDIAKPRAQRNRERALRYRALNPSVPVVENLDGEILKRVESNVDALDMSVVHSTVCETTHCVAGWAVHLAGKEGYELERTWGWQRAGAAIYRASVGEVPHFFASNEAALTGLRRRAEETATLAEGSAAVQP